MARLHYVKKARKTIYEHGKTVTRINRKGEKVEKHDRTIPENKKDKVFIAKGQEYYWWQFRFGPKIYSKTEPRRSQLTQSAFFATLYDIEDDIAQAQAGDDIADLKQGWIEQLEELRDECQSALDNTPESLQESSVNNERISALEQWIDELEDIDTDVDDDAIHAEAEQEANEENEGKEDDEIDESLIDIKAEDKREDRYREILEEIQATSISL